MTTPNHVKPIKLLGSLLFFGGGALLFFFTERLLLPYLDENEVNRTALFLVMAIPHMLFFAVALLGYKREGNRWDWKTFSSRFRYKAIKGKMWFWALLIVLIDISLYLAVYKLAFPVVKYVHDAFPPPSIVTSILGDGETFAGQTVRGNWMLLPLFFFYYCFNVLGEEFLWRGYLFPRQELTHGKYTWIVHGLLWTLFHIFAPYNALLVLPGALFMSYVVQKTQNNTIFLLSHAALNAIPIIGLIFKIIG